MTGIRHILHRSCLGNLASFSFQGRQRQRLDWQCCLLIRTSMNQRRRCHVTSEAKDQSFSGRRLAGKETCTAVWIASTGEPSADMTWEWDVTQMLNYNPPSPYSKSRDLIQKNQLQHASYLSSHFPCPPKL